MEEPGTDMPKPDAPRERPAVLRVLAAVGVALVVVFMVASLVALFAERWLFATWDALSVDEILFHIMQPLTGADSYTVWEFVRYYLPYLLASIAALLAVLVIGRAKKHLGGAALYVLAVSAALLAWGASDFASQVDLEGYLAGGDAGAEFVEARYHDPRDVEVVFPEEKRNLIFIYLESIEITCADEDAGGAFEKSAIPELEKLALEQECFAGDSGLLNGAYSLPGTTWTMGALFAQTSGLPLKMAIGGNEGGTLESFFPNLVTLGDMLEEEGYSQGFLIGSEAKFGGRDSYFKEHGDYDLLDYVYARRRGLIPADYREFWGYEDEKLFEFAKDEILKRAERDEPFNFTILTVDTHFEDGYVCRLCRREFGDNQYANVHACSSRQVAKFVSWLQEQDFYENTAVVLCGDHVTMDRDFYEDVDKDYGRRVYTAFLNSAAEPRNPSLERVYSTFDIFPTTLAAMGATIEGERLGLGVNLYSTARTILEELGLPAVNAELSKQSSFLERFGDVGITEELLENVAEASGLRFVAGSDEAGGMRLALELGGTLNPAFVRSACAVVIDTRTGERTEFALHDATPENDPNAFRLDCAVPFGEEDLPYLSCEAYVSAGAFDDVLLATWRGESVPEEAAAEDGAAGEGVDGDSGENSGEGFDESGVED